MDLLFAGILVFVLPAIPLFHFHQRLSWNVLPEWVFYVLALVWLLVCGCWAWTFRTSQKRTDIELPISTSEDCDQQTWVTTALIAGLLLGLTIVCYYKPMIKHFWGGCDDYCHFDNDSAQIWSRTWDGFGRPFLGWSSIVARTLTPDRIEGFLWTACALCWLNGLLLYAVLRRALPHAETLSIIAAILLIVNQADSARYYVLWAANPYWIALFLLLLSYWLLLISLQHESRLLLVASCLALSSSLLTYEGGFPLALLGLAIVWLCKVPARCKAVWSATWMLAIALLASRYLVYLVCGGGKSYQAQQANEAISHPYLFWQNCLTHLKTFTLYFRAIEPQTLWEYWSPALWAFALTAFLVFLAARRDLRPVLSMTWGIALGFAFGAFLLGTIPFLHMRGTFRTVFYSTPGQAVVVAIVLSIAVSRLTPKLRNSLLAWCVGLLASASAAQSEKSQSLKQQSDGISFEKTVRLFEQVRAISPHIDEDTLVLFILEDNKSNPFLVNYACRHTTKLILGYAAAQANFQDPYGHNVRFTRDGVSYADFDTVCSEYPYEHVIAFSTHRDGTLSLLRELPKALVPQESQAEKYNPLTRLHPGAIKPLPIFRYLDGDSAKSDVVDPHRGVILCGDWSPMQHDQAGTYRWAKNGAGIVINPLAGDNEPIAMEVEPCGPLEGRPCELNIINSQCKVVARLSIHGRTKVLLPIPADRSKVEVYQFQFQCENVSSVDMLQPTFRLFRQERKAR